MKKLFNSLGFSLVEIMVVLGIMGGISLGVAQLMKQSTTSANFVEAKTEENEITRQISLMIAKKDACTHTMLGRGVGDNVPTIKNNQGADVYAVNGLYGNGAITITSMRLANSGATTIPADGRGTLFLEVTLNRRKVKSAATDFTKRILIAVKLDPTSKIESCSITDEDLVEQAKEEMCIAFGGVWVPGTPGVCNLMGCNVDNNNNVTSTLCLRTRGVMKIGDTMTGALTVANGGINVTNTGINVAAGGVNVQAGGVNVTAGDVNLGTGGRVCINGVCRDHTPRACEPGWVVTGIKADGTIDCAPANSGNKSCIGAWSPCTAQCGGGTETFVIYQPQLPGGDPCTNASGDVRSCNTAPCVNCQGSWSACSSTCGPGTRTYNITQNAGPGGTACGNTAGATEACNNGNCNYSCPNIASSCRVMSPYNYSCTNGSQQTTCVGYQCTSWCPASSCTGVSMPTCTYYSTTSCTPVGVACTQLN